MLCHEFGAMGSSMTDKARLRRMLENIPHFARTSHSIAMEELLHEIINALPEEKPKTFGQMLNEYEPIGAVPKQQPIGGPEQKAAEELWLQTLHHFGATRPSGQLSYNERKSIAESIRTNGAPMTMAALFGRRYEQATVSFDPAKHLSVDRTFQRGLFDKFVNEAAKHKAKKRK